MSLHLLQLVNVLRGQNYEPTWINRNQFLIAYDFYAAFAGLV